MSLILDALKRSEEERRQVPAASPSTAATTDGRRANGRRIRSRWVTLVVVAVGLVVGWALWRTPAERPDAAGDSAAGPQAGAAVSTASSPMDSGTAVRAGGAPPEARVEAGALGVEDDGRAGRAVVDGATGPATVVDIPERAPPRSADPDSPVAAEPGASPAAEGRQPRRTAPAPPPDPAFSAASPPLDRLPYETRRALAPLRIDVHVYDADPLRRFVMINGKTLGAGGEIKPGLAVEEIVREGVVLTWNGRPFFLGAGD